MKGASSTAAVLAMARKDLTLLFRNRGALFFTFGWPVIMSLAFGTMFGGGGDRGRIPVAVVDEDGTPEAARLLDRLRATDGLEVAPATRPEAEQLVRTGKRTAAVILPRGYGQASDRLFYGEPRRLEIAVDPARKAEAAMLEGILTGAAMQSLQDLFDDPGRSAGMVDKALADLAASPEAPRRQETQRFLGELKTFLGRPSEPKAAGGRAGSGSGWKPVAIEKRDLRTERRGPANAFEVTFPQGMLWGVIACALGFAVSLVSERTRGTLMRLQTAPVSRAHVLAGKALACLVAIAAVLGLLLLMGWAFFGVRPASWALLALGAGSLAACFVGIMMVVAVLGKTEQSAGGLGWAIMMPLTLLGGGMVPFFAMPRWMQAAGSVSPVKWGILALEGAIWRGFGPAEMLLPCGVLLAVGVVGFLLGARLFAAEG